MYILTVIPIKKGFQKENLTYFCSQKVTLGSIVEIPIRKKTADAIVVDIENAHDVKFDIKNKDYQLKKINKIKGSAIFSNAFFETCESLKYYYNSNTGVIIDSILPKIFLDSISSFKKTKNNSKENNIDINNNIDVEKLIFQSPWDERISWYKTLIRESFAKKESLYIVAPTIYDTEILKNELSKGIDSYIYIFNSRINNKNLIENYNKATTEEHPVLIIGTASFICIPREDIKTIIIEKESSEAYKQIRRPFVDLRNFIEVFSYINKVKIILSDTILRPETIYRHENGELGEVRPPSFRLKETKKQILINMKKEFEEKRDKKFEIFGDETKKIIDESLLKKESIFIYITRKGLAPVTACNDCGHTLICPSCETPIVLYGTKQMTANKGTTKRIFMCNKCGRKETTETRCPLCNSWNLTPLGIGADKVYEEIKKIYPQSNILQIDKENTTDKEAKEIINIFEKNKGSILIGTEMAFSYIKENVDHSIVVSLDGILSIPSFNINQKILHIIERLQIITNNNLVIQTRDPENKILENILKGNVLPIFRQDLIERESFGYPPFKKLIKITFIGNKEETEKSRNYINKILENYDPQIFSAFIGKIKGEYVTNTIIKINPQMWQLPKNNKNSINEDLALKLSNLSQAFSINIEPEDLL